MSRWAIVQHVPYEGPGLLAAVLAEFGAQVQSVRVFAGEPLPAADELDGLVVLGGPMSAFDDDEHPSLPAERALLAEAVQRGLPVLGVCLGAQLLAAALGGQVFRGPAPEIGLGVVELSSAARRDPVFRPVGHVLPALHWHGDTYTLPDGAVRLGSTYAYPEQAFRVGERAYGLQFHVEVDAGWVETVADRFPGQLDRRHLALVSRTGRGILRRFVQLAVSETAHGASVGTPNRRACYSTSAD